MTFLDGVRLLVQLSKITSNASPSTVVGQTGLLKDMVEYYKAAHEEIQNKWQDWDFLWNTDTITTVNGASVYPGEDDLGIWDESRLYYNNTKLDVYEWPEYIPDTSLSNGPPEFAVIRPDNQLLIVPTPDDAYTISYDYYRVGKTLSADSDEPYIPARYQMAIVGRALMMFANTEVAEELKAQGQEIYQTYMDSLESHQLSRQRQRRGRIAAADITVVAE